MVCYDPAEQFNRPVGGVGLIREADIIAALDKPRSLYAIKQRVLPGEKGTEELQIVLMRLRDEKKVAFDINTGRWSWG